MSIPNIVTGISVRNLRVDRTFKVTWDAVAASPTVTQYNIYRAENSYAGFGSVGTVTATVLQYIDTTIPFSFDRAWFYKVTAVNSDGESPVAATQAVTDFDYLVFSRVPSELDYKSGLIQWVSNEDPIGTIDGINNVFYTRYNYKPRTLQIFANDYKLLAAEFTEANPNAFTLSVTLTVGDTLSVNYIRF